VIERAVLATKGSSLHVPSSDTHQVEKVSVSRTLAEVERDHILHTLRESHWVVGGWNGAAAKLGLSRTTLIARMQRLGIARESRPDGNLPSVSSRSTATKPRNGRNSGDARERGDDPHWSA
jgi:DNA-binding NtrC family response regulator